MVSSHGCIALPKPRQRTTWSADLPVTRPLALCPCVAAMPSCAYNTDLLVLVVSAIFFFLVIDHVYWRSTPALPYPLPFCLTSPPPHLPGFLLPQTLRPLPRTKMTIMKRSTLLTATKRGRLRRSLTEATKTKTRATVGRRPWRPHPTARATRGRLLLLGEWRGCVDAVRSVLRGTVYGLQVVG